MLILSDVCDPSHITAHFLRHCISALQKNNNSVVGEKLKNNELEQFLCTPFHFEKNIPKASLITIVKNVDNEKTEKVLAKISELENKLSIVCQALSEETTDNPERQHEVKTLFKEYKVVVVTLKKKKVEKLANLTQRNVTKRVNRQKENNKVLQEQITTATNKISDLEKENDELNKSLDSALKTTLALRKSVSYLKIKKQMKKIIIIHIFRV